MRQTKILLLLSLLMALCLITSMAAAEDNSWMPDRYTYLKPVPQERIILGLPAGMVLASQSYNAQMGLLEYVIDTEKTDWATVLANSYRASSGQAYIQPGIKLPPDAVGQRSIIYFVDPSQYERDLLSSIENQTLKYGDAVQSQWIGKYDEANAMYMPEKSGWTRSIAVVWYDENAGKLRGEFLAFSVSYTDGDAFTVQMPKVSMADVTPNVKNHAGVSANKDGNSVRYQVDQRYNAEYVYTAVAAPQIAGKDTSLWTCYVGNQACEMANAGEYGLQRRSALIAHSLFTNDDIVSNSHALQWRDELGTTQQVVQLSSLMTFGTLNPWPTYIGWTSVPSSRMKLTYLNPIESGTSMDYDGNTGIAYFHIMPKELPESADYARAQMQLSITPPEGATAYQLAKGNGTKAFGMSTNLENYFQNQFQSQPRYSVSEKLTIDQRLFDSYPKKGEEMTLYKSAMILGEFSAEYKVINWYKDINDAEPFKTEYVFLKMDDCLLQQITKPYNSEEEALQDKFTAPVVVIPNENSNEEMLFVAEIYPIDVDNARYYELRLIDQNGDAANLPAKAKIIMRYPEGITFDEAVNIRFDLRHLNNKHQTFETFSVENGNLHLEEDYLWFTPSSLSPFILEWTAATESAIDSALPDTGDHSWPLVILAMLAICSSALFVQLNRRRI